MSSIFVPSFARWRSGPCNRKGKPEHCGNLRRAAGRWRSGEYGSADRGSCTEIWFSEVADPSLRFRNWRQPALRRLIQLRPNPPDQSGTLKSINVAHPEILPLIIDKNTQTDVTCRTYRKSFPESYPLTACWSQLRQNPRKNQRANSQSVRYFGQ